VLDDQQPVVQVIGDQDVTGSAAGFGPRREVAAPCAGVSHGALVRTGLVFWPHLPSCWRSQPPPFGCRRNGPAARSR